MGEWRSVLEHAQQEVVDRDRLSGALRTVWPDVEIVSAEAILGGLGSVLHRVFVLGAPVRTVVLRQLLVELGDDAQTLRRELVAHRHLPELDLPVPVAHWADAEGEVLGRPAMTLADVPGRMISRDLVTGPAQRALADAITRLAAAPTDGLAGLDTLADVDAHADRFGSPATTSELVDPQRVRTHVDAHRRWFVPRRQVVHCDLHGGNVLWDGDVVTGVLDWPGVALGVAACDEAYAWLDTVLALGPVAGDGLQAAIDAARQGPGPDEGEVALWRAVALRRALPTPGPWTESYRAAGIDVSEEQVEEHYVRLVEHHVGGH